MSQPLTANVSLQGGTPVTDRVVYVVSDKDIGYEVVAPAEMRRLEVMCNHYKAQIEVLRTNMVEMSDAFLKAGAAGHALEENLRRKLSEMDGKSEEPKTPGEPGGIIDLSDKKNGMH